MSAKVYEKFSIIHQRLGVKEIVDYVNIGDMTEWVDYFHILEELYEALRHKGVRVEYKFDAKKNDVDIRPLDEDLAPIIKGCGGEHIGDPYVLIRADWFSDEMAKFVENELATFRSIHLRQ